MKQETVSGMYVGICVDNEDPEKRGRIKVRVPIIYGDIPKDHLPWAEPVLPYAYDKQTFLFVPEEDAFVVVWFLNNSKSKPIWVGCIHRTSENEMTEVGKKNYPNRKTIKTKTGYAIFDDEDELIEIKHKSGSCISFLENGEITVHSASNMNLISDGKILMNPPGKPSVTVPED